MKTSSIEVDTPPGQDKGDSIHPILGNYHLPVEIENTRKQSGLHNLSREGWSEEKCRNYLIRLCSDVPRNFPYKEGLRILHPRLQERFGDENVDLGLGVLEELIEVEEPPPFAPSVFQRWKHEHLRRKASYISDQVLLFFLTRPQEDFTNPHAPHTATIQAPVVPTKKLNEYREWQAHQHLHEPQISPSAKPYCESCNSKIAHQPSWKIEHSVFVSVGGKPATLAYCPTPAELHKGMWDPEYGRGGARARPDTAQTSSPESTNGLIRPNIVSSKYSTPTRSFMSNAKRELGHKVMSALSETRESSSNLASQPQVELVDVQRREELSRSRGQIIFEAPRKTGSVGQCATRKVPSMKNVPLPRGRDIPNVNFARKHELIPSGQPAPEYLLGLRQPTFDEGVDRLYEWKDKTARCPSLNPLRHYLSKYHSVPASPSDFFDGGLDYKWSTPEIIENMEIDASNLHSASGIEEVLESTHLTIEDSYNTTEYYQVESIYHVHTTDCVEQPGPRFPVSGISNTHATKDQEEILYPTVYIRPLENDVSKNKSSTEHLKKEEHEHQDRNSYDGTCQSWECRYKHEYRKSGGDVVKWIEPYPESSEIEESEEFEISRLSPAVYSPSSSLDPHSKNKGFPRMTEGSNVSKNLEVLVAQTYRSQVNTSCSNVNISPPARLSERSYISKIPIRNECFAAFGVTGSMKVSNPSMAENPLTLQVRNNMNIHTPSNVHSAISNFLKSSHESPGPLNISEPNRRRAMDLDGASDDCLPKQNNRTKQATRDNRPPGNERYNSLENHNNNSLYDEYHVGEAAKRFLMELNQGRLPTLHSPTIDPPQPLHICKQPSQVQLEQGGSPQNNNIGNEKRKFPPRSSSIPERERLVSIEQATSYSFDRETATHKSNSRFEEPTISTGRNAKVSLISGDQQNTPETTARSTVSDIKQYYFSEHSGGGLFGDFIPIGTPGSIYSPQQEQPPVQTMSVNSSSYGRKAEKFVNPYEFEPDTPLVVDESRQTRITDFMYHKYDDVRPASSPNLGHTKNSRSVGYSTNRGDLLTAPECSRHGHGLQRSGTSPSVTPLRFAARKESPSPDHQAYYADVESISPILQTADSTKSLPRRGRAATLEPSRMPVHKGSQERVLQSSSSPVRQAVREYPRQSRSPIRKMSGDHHMQMLQKSSDEELADSRGRSATYAPVRKQTNSNYSNESYSSSISTTINRQMTRSPPKNLVDVAEQDEPILESPDIPISPKKRSRSPMKKMFGEHGWLGSSPNEIIPALQNSKSAQKIDKPKKPGMMEKIKNKIEGFTEKADLKGDKNRISVLSISINPYEQARYLVELELMVVHTANTFLMIQFSQGRMSIDSIKKTVDSWKNKGRPAVVEFMYDQGTQRDLVTANQYNFRFYGDRVGDDVRISSMLYNWKQVASLMSIRTFCNADTVLLKLVFDVEQILELIGGSEQIMLRLQLLRLSINEAIRAAKAEKTTSRGSRNVQEKQREPHPSSQNDPYGGMKLVPDHYAE